MTWAPRSPTDSGTVANVDLYLDADDLGRVVGLPIDFGGFDDRLFGRNDAMLDYRAVVYEIADTDDAVRRRPMLQRRPGIVHLVGKGWRDPNDGDRRAIDAIIQTGSRVVVPCPWLAWQIRTALPEHAGQVATAPASPIADEQTSEARFALRERLGIPTDAFVVGRVVAGPAEGTGLAFLHAFKNLTRLHREAVLVLVEWPDAEGDEADLRAMADRLNIGHRAFLVRAEDRSGFADLVDTFDLAVYQGAEDTGSLLLDLFRADVPTILFRAEAPVPPEVARRVESGPSLVETLRELALDPRARSELVRAVRNHFVDSEARPSRAFWADQIERCAIELPRGPRLRQIAPVAGREAPSSPHFPRAASATTAAVIRSR